LGQTLAENLFGKEKAAIKKYLPENRVIKQGNHFSFL